MEISIFSEMKKMKKQAGQTLIEAIVAIALGIVVVVALVGLSVRANRNVNASKVAETASKFAEEGQELVRNIRDRDQNGSIRNLAGATTWDLLYSYAGSGTMNEVKFKLDKTAPCSTSSWCLNASPAADPFDSFAIGGVSIERRIFISDDENTVPANTVQSVINCKLKLPAGSYTETVPLDFSKLLLTASEVKLARVNVRWTDTTGTHNINLQSCITKKS